MPGRSAISENASQAGAIPPSTPGTNRLLQNTDVDQAASRARSTAATQPVEPEDAYLTGVSRSLQRRLLGLNVDTKRTTSNKVPRSAESKK